MSARQLVRPLRALRPLATSTRLFHGSVAARIQVGAAIPHSTALVEGSPGNKVDLAEELKSHSKALIIGVPGAFSGPCSSTHIPSYISHPQIRDAGQVYVISVNDAFVMKAWAEQLDPAKETGVRAEPPYAHGTIDEAWAPS